MIAKLLKYAACTAFVLTLACGPLFAQSAPQTIHVTPSSAVNTPSDPLPPALVRLYTNLGPTPTNNYNMNTGFYLLGSANTVALSEQWVAIPFTNAKASHITQIQAAVELVTTGTPGAFTLGIYSDNAGVVGTALATVNATATAVFPSCCTLVTVHLPGTGVALTAKTQYWIVATANDVTNSALTTVWVASNNVNAGFDIAQGGWFTASLNLPATAALGTIP